MAIKVVNIMIFLSEMPLITCKCVAYFPVNELIGVKNSAKFLRFTQRFIGIFLVLFHLLTFPFLYLVELSISLFFYRIFVIKY